MNAFTTLIDTPLRAAIAGALCVSAPLAIAAPIAPLAAQNAPPTESAQIDRVLAAFRAISTLQADFTQSDRNGSVVTGVLTLRNPGHIRFEYEEDVNMLVVSNGRTLTLVDYDVRQVERWPIRNSPLGALLDPERDVAQFGQLVPSTNPNVLSVAVADPDRPEFGEITLIFLRNAAAPGGLELVSWVMLDSQNIRTTVRLRNHAYGVSVPDSTFRYRDPRPSSRRPG